MAERLRFPAACLSVQTEPLEEGEQVLDGEHQLQPDLVGRELAEGEAAQSGVLAAADAERQYPTQESPSSPAESPTSLLNGRG